MRLDGIPFFERLDPAKSILLSGAGGGFDIFAGLPLYFALRARGHEVHLANLTFTPFASEAALIRVTADSDGPDGYFPEGHLSTWFREELGEDVPIHAFQKVGVRPLRAAYETVLHETGADSIVLVDGGTDSLMRGDEAGLGTPAEDMSSIAAVHGLELPRKLLVSIGFGIDTYHGVAHADVLEAIAALDREDAYLGAFTYLRQMEEVELYRRACDYVHARMPQRPSIVNLSILSAIDGQFGDHHRTERTRGSELFINPLMSLVFAFELGPLAERVQYLDALETTDTALDIAVVLEGVRKRPGRKPRRSIPL